ncbi:MAG TPA: hypothetical protein VE464_24910 [Streptosporangiaceae bacterium]|nr:hypothetical protein [Streptosporangiaceae bacterium]
MPVTGSAVSRLIPARAAGTPRRSRLAAARARSSWSSTPTRISTSRRVVAGTIRSWRPASVVLNQPPLSGTRPKSV